MAALDRLRELEERELALTLATDGEMEDGSPGSPDMPVIHSDIVVAPSEASFRGKFKWTVHVLWATSVLMALLIPTIVSTLVIQRVRADPYDVGATQVASLAVERDLDIPASFLRDGEADTRAFSQFFDLQVLVSFHGSPVGESYDQCIWVMDSKVFAEATDDPSSYKALNGCSTSPFPPSVTMEVTRDMSDELLRQYPEGTALQFVFDQSKDEVVVSSSPK